MEHDRAHDGGKGRLGVLGFWVLGLRPWGLGLGAYALGGLGFGGWRFGGWGGLGLKIAFEYFVVIWNMTELMTEVRGFRGGKGLGLGVVRVWVWGGRVLGFGW